jgi:hypothetical protein
VSWFALLVLAFVFAVEARERVDEVAVLSLVALERRRLKGLRAWKEAMELRRRSELRRDSEPGASPDSLLPDGMLAVKGGG